MSPRLIEEDKVYLGVKGLNKGDGGLPALGGAFSNNPGAHP